jgi:hypothetical protein
MDRESDMAEEDMGMSRPDEFTSTIHPPLQKTGVGTAGSEGRKRSERK